MHILNKELREFKKFRSLRNQDSQQVFINITQQNRLF